MCHSVGVARAGRVTYVSLRAPPLCAGGLPPNKLVLGLASYGRGYEASDPARLNFGDPARGPVPRGPSTGEPGYLAYYEVVNILEDPNAVRATPWIFR
eukprot:2393814-Pyramimonas_sp.AAC.1